MNKLKNLFTARDWHIWVSLALALPILLVAFTAVLIAHDKSLGLRKVPVTAEWLPGYGPGAVEPPEARAVLTAADGSRWIGTRLGVYRVLPDGQPLAVEVLNNVEVRSMAEAAGAILVGTKQGLWRGRGEDWRRILDQEVWHVGVAAGGGMVATLKEQGVVVSRDGGASWSADPQVAAALAMLPARAQPRVTLGKLVLDLHTGKALLGKKAEWIWIDLVGGAMLLLALTGVYMWWRSQQRRSQMLQAGRPASSATAAPAAE
ncbi:MAG: PepSY domain-containing protein [Betaproteobacteria bacterium]|nr:PepSY domain-containing protein [Betaproteobacteria bacterium]